MAVTSPKPITEARRKEIVRAGQFSKLPPMQGSAGRTLYAVGSGNVSSTGIWSLSSGGATGQAIPTASDDVILDSNTGNVTIDSTLNCRSFDCNSPNGTGAYAGTLTHNTGQFLAPAPSVAGTTVILRFSSAMTYTLVGSPNISTTLATVGTTMTVTTAGQTLPNISFNAATSSGFQLTDTFTTATTATVTLTQGTLNTTGQTCNWGFFSNNTANTRTLTITNSTINITGTSGALWSNTSSGTINATGSTINFTGGGSGAKTVTLNNFAYGAISFSGGGTGGITWTGSPSMTALTITAPATISHTAGTTKTFTSLTAVGSSGHLITLTSVTAGTQFNYSCASGIISSNWLSLKDANATGGATFYAGHNSTNVSNNTGWSFTSYFPLAFTAGLQSIGRFNRATAHYLVASLSLGGQLGKSLQRLVSAGVGFVGGLPKQVARGFTASVSSVGAWRTTVPHHLQFVASLSSTGTLIKTSGKRLAAGLDSAAQLAKSVARKFAAVLSMSETETALYSSAQVSVQDQATYDAALYDDAASALELAAQSTYLVALADE